MYLVKTPRIIKELFSELVWSINTNEKNIYLSFDDGPHPTITTFVLENLKQYNATASFFCIGKNVETHPEIYEKIINEGHLLGNHTQQHLNGWKTSNEHYINDVMQASKVIKSNYFRPPYGKIKRNQSNYLIKKGFQIIMWDVLSGDFDTSISKETCLKNVITKTKDGSIVVFHDSEKAFEKLQFTLPRMLQYFSELGYSFKRLP